ncbi:hypothetical protein DH2020_035757 [Rehmannia glutinosa]|uniref:ATP-dependent RNA helicase n=1 Tax=Rehmannia glutinosa TaxID=99300 RepID=A0ABR0V8S6_REHGL
MASESSEKKKARRNLKKRARVNSDQHLERLNSLPWSSSLPESNGAGDDGFSLFIGSDELEGGFLTLDEIDESEYGLDIPNDNVKSERQKLKGKTKSKKRKIYEGDADESSGGELSNESDNKAKESIEEDEKKEVKRKKKKKNVKRKKKDHQQNNETIKAEETAEPAAECFLQHENLTSASDGRDNGDAEDDSVDEEEYYAWNELRLHPMIMKSIYRLNFKEPTPIQKACIPAASHQGKDVIGAAETGSGKTLAFGLPILQRLLEEREKEERLMAEKGEANERIAPQGVLRALIVTPTRELALQVTDHLKAVALGTNVRVVPIVGGMSTEKQERLLKARPEIVVGTPGRLWELMSGGEIHLVELHSLSFFVLDEADRMIETGHFRELQSIIDMLPMNRESAESQPQNTQSCVTVASLQRKKRQTLVFSATLALSHDFRKKLKHGSVNAKKDGLNSIETLSERAGMRANTAVVDLTNASIMANKLVESIIDFTPHFFIIAYPHIKCMDPSFRDAAAGTPKGSFAQLLASLIGFASSSQVYFHVSIGSNFHVSQNIRFNEFLVQHQRVEQNKNEVDIRIDQSETHCLVQLPWKRVLTGIGGNKARCSGFEQIPVNYVAQSSQVSGTRIDLNVRGSEQSSVDRFRANEHGILVATDAAARGLDIPGVRTVVHYQLPLSAEIYVHRCGRTARASTDGCSIALISPNDASKFAALCKSFAKESFQRFPVEISYMPEIMKRSSLAHQIDKIVRKDSQEKAEKTWLERNAESVELVLDDDDSEEDRVKKYRQNKSKSNQLKKLQQELNTLLSRPLQPKAFSKRFLAGAGVSPLLQHQLEELSKQKLGNVSNFDSNKRRKLVVIGQDCVEPLQALRSASNEACLDLKEIAEKHKNSDNLRRKRKEMKKRESKGKSYNNEKVSTPNCAECYQIIATSMDGAIRR